MWVNCPDLLFPAPGPSVYGSFTRISTPLPDTNILCKNILIKIITFTAYRGSKYLDLSLVKDINWVLTALCLLFLTWVRSLGLLFTLLGNHVQLGYPVLLHCEGQGDPVLLDQHPVLVLSQSVHSYSLEICNKKRTMRSIYLILWTKSIRIEKSNRKFSGAATWVK